MKNFVAIDVETANYERSSICSVGCVKVKNGIITDKYYSLVHPEPDWYVRRFTAIHGLSDEDTYNAPTFQHVWNDVTKFAEGLPFVAHNASFDFGCIKAACKVYQLEPPTSFRCTLAAARRMIPHHACPSKSLPNLCKFLAIPFSDHHNALADAEACAKIAICLFQ